MNYRDMFYEIMKDQDGFRLGSSCDRPAIMNAHERRSNNIPEVKKVIWNKNACIVIWNDDTKTVVKCQEGDVWNKEVGLMAAFSKKLFGNDNTFNKIIDRYCSRFFDEDERVQKALEKLDQCIDKAYNGDRDRMTRAIYMSGQFENVYSGFCLIRHKLPDFAAKFIKLANKYFEADLDAYNLRLSVVETQDNTFKIVLVEQKGE